MSKNIYTLTYPQTCGLLQCSKSHLLKIAQCNILNIFCMSSKSVKVCYFINMSDLMSWIKHGHFMGSKSGLYTLVPTK